MSSRVSTQVFELATFKKINPDGTVVMAPIFLETTVVLFYISNLCAAAMQMVLRAGGSTRVLFALPIISLPFLVLVHRLRRSFEQKHKLFSQFQQFELDSARCVSDSDCEFIYATIDQLYGSKEAFVSYVRGSLREELLGPMTRSVLPETYTLLIMSPFVSLHLDLSVALSKQGAPFAVVLLYLVAALVIGVFLIIRISINVMILLCDRFAKPAHGSVIVDSWLQTRQRLSLLSLMNLVELTQCCHSSNGVGLLGRGLFADALHVPCSSALSSPWFTDGAGGVWHEPLGACAR